jgi:ribosome-binding protein aMBF1 (putative translation factor)
MSNYPKPDPATRFEYTWLNDVLSFAVQPIHSAIVEGKSLQSGQYFGEEHTILRVRDYCIAAIDVCPDNANAAWTRERGSTPPTDDSKVDDETARRSRRKSLAGLMDKRANAETRKRRYAVLRRYRADHDLNSMGDLARRFGLSVTAIQGMARGDRKRYSEEKLATFLKSIGVSPGEW